MAGSAAIPLTIVIMGDGGVGKSSATLALLRREFSHDYDPTVEDSYSIPITVDGRDYSVQLIDTAGQEEYRQALDQRAREADGFVVVYSIDSATSFELVPDFLHVARKARSVEENPTPLCTPENTPFPFLLLGNKCDMPERRVVSAQEGLSFARTCGGAFFECSALSRANIDAAFTSLIRSIARTRAAREDYKRKNPKDRDCEGFNGNIGVLDKIEAAAAETSAGSGRKVGLAEEEELSLSEARERQRRERAGKGVALDKKHSRSIGGLGRDPSKYEKEQKTGCGCTIQ